jgi:hypothetical protein
LANVDRVGFFEPGNSGAQPIIKKTFRKAKPLGESRKKRKRKSFLLSVENVSK